MQAHFVHHGREVCRQTPLYDNPDLKLPAATDLGAFLRASSWFSVCSVVSASLFMQ
jgi:hypothetical protein